MESKKVLLSIIFTVLIFICCIIWYNTSRLKYEVVKIDKIYSAASNNNYTILHVGKLSTSDTEILKRLKHDYDFNVIVSDTTFEVAKKYIEEDYNENTRFVVFTNANIVGTMDKDQDYEYYVKMLDRYFYHILPDNEEKYTIAKNAEEFIEAVESKNYTVAVFGYTSCSYCTLYKPIINEIINDYGVKIYYFDSTTYDQDEYEKIRELDYKVPAKCTIDKKEVSLGDSFPSPMTLIFKGGKTVDCIKGYVKKGAVVDVLKQYKIVKEK